MEDITIKCVQCGNDFVFTTGEQRYYQERNFSSPKRCPQCRKNKARLEGDQARPVHQRRENSVKRQFGDFEE